VDGETAADVGQGPAADVLLTVAADADMLVLGRRRRGRLGRVVLGSVSSTVVEHATVPVTVVRGHAGAGRAEPGARTGENPVVGAGDAEESSDAPSRVVVGVDTSAPSVAALRHAGEVAARNGAVLEVIFAWQITTLAPLPGSWGWAPPLDEYERFAGQCLDATVQKAGVRLPPDRLRRSVVHGRAASSLLEASRTAERVVVGARGLGGFDRLLLGSVSRQVLDYAACPVTVVRA
jgi:nucleotide-binding universal stress UspA family protein